MVYLDRSSKFTGICIALYVSYAIFIFVMLPLLIPDPLTMQRSLLEQQTRHLGNLSNYTLETGGTPIRSLLVTFKGSGAINLLHNLSHQPGCYHHYAPLIAFRNKIANDQVSLKALSQLVALFNCDYNNTEHMLYWGMRTPIFRRFYGQQYKLGMTYPYEMCWNPTVLSSLCKIHPFINMSVYNLKLKFLALLLEHADLNVRIVLLIRDPRGTIYSRSDRIWCASTPECSEPRYLCKDMVNEFKIAKKLVKEYPTRFRVIRYEDLSLHPLRTTEEIFDFYGVPIDTAYTKIGHNRRVQLTNGFIRGGLANSAADYDVYGQPYQWIKELKPDKVKLIENDCGEALDLWGYRTMKNFTGNISNFDPLIKPAPLST